jgi:predicted RNase H-like HicB family nuclease
MRYVSFKDYVKAILKTAEYRKDSEMGCIVAIAPHLSGCMIQEDNFEDARESLIDAIELWITAGFKDGDMPVINGMKLAISIGNF